MGLSYTTAAGPSQRIHSQVRVPQDSGPHFTVSDSRLPQPGGQVPLFISPRNRVAHLHPQALGSLSVAFYDSQGYGGRDSNPPPHTGRPIGYALTHKFEANRIKTPPPTVPPLFAFVFVAAQAWACRVKSSRVSCYDRRSVGQSTSPPRNKVSIWVPRPDFHLCQTVAGTLLWSATPPPPRLEDGSDTHNRCWPSPAQLLSGPSLAGPATTLHRLRFEISPFVASTTGRATVEAFDRTSTRD
jgi:hypothetical protein